MIGAADDRILPMIVIGGFAGLRHAEISRLDWQDIDLEEGFIEVKASNAKTDNQAVSHKVGPETRLFFRRYVAQLSNQPGVLGRSPCKDLSLSDIDQAKIISEQCGIPLEVSVSGLQLIRENEKMSLVDPLTLPWLN